MKDRVPKTNEAFKEWEEKARSEFRGNELCGLNWHTPEGIELEALYTASDLEKLEWIDSLPGLFPFIRGLRLQCMQAGHGQSANTQVFPPLKNPTVFTEKI